jgi:hypothetical protein
MDLPCAADGLRRVHGIAQMRDTHTGDDCRIPDDECVREVVDQPVAAEEQQAAGEKTRDQRSVTGRLRGRLFGEIERDRADQHSCAEAHDQPDHAQGDADPKRDDSPDHER